VRYGQILVLSEEDETPEYCLAIEDPCDRRKMLIGVWIGCEPFVPKQTVSWTAIRQDEIALCLSKHARATATYDVIVHRSAGADYFWSRDEEDWTPLGKLTTIRRRGETLASIRGLRITTMSEQDIPLLPEWLRFPRAFGGRMQEVLDEISKSFSLCVPTKCTLDVEENHYVARFHNEDGEELLEERTIQQTSELIALLRRPMVNGLPLQSSKRPATYLTWNPYNDIDYDKVQLLKPYVERKTPYIHVVMTLPATAKALLNFEVKHETLIVTHDDALCPIAGRGTRSHDACWRIGFSEQIEDSYLQKLTETGLTDTEIENLLSSGAVFLESARYEFDYEFSPDPNEQEGTVFRESRLFSRRFNLKRVSPGTYLEMESEKLVCTLHREPSLIAMTAISDTTGDQVYWGELVTLDSGIEIGDALQGAKNTLESMVQDHFGDDEEVEDRIIDYDWLVEKIGAILQDVYLGGLKGSADTGGDMDEEGLEELLEFHREMIDDDPVSEEGVAGTLSKLAMLHFENDRLDDAYDAIDECIDIHETHLKE